MGFSVKPAWNAVKTVVRNLPIVRNDLVSAATAGITVVGVFEVSFPQVSVAHMALFATITASLTAVASFLSNNKIVSGVNDFSGNPIWKAKLSYLLRGGR